MLQWAVPSLRRARLVYLRNYSKRCIGSKTIGEKNAAKQISQTEILNDNRSL